VGVYGVAESAALYSAKKLTQSAPELILTKQKNTKATCAIARAYAQ
jgi:cobalt-precorrin 5A hydrolase